MRLRSESNGTSAMRGQGLGPARVFSGPMRRRGDQGALGGVADGAILLTGSRFVGPDGHRLQEGVVAEGPPATSSGTAGLSWSSGRA